MTLSHAPQAFGLTSAPRPLHPEAGRRKTALNDRFESGSIGARHSGAPEISAWPVSARPIRPLAGRSKPSDRPEPDGLRPPGAVQGSAPRKDLHRAQG